ncbi:MAG: hypothetical protein DK306_002177 [Chloroflexi bacterium]|nr:MAG: hypothetical protein DK306_002177 [Chloroflexota bacterium]
MRIWLMVALVALLAAACGGDDDPAAQPTDGTTAVTNDSASAEPAAAAAAGVPLGGLRELLEFLPLSAQDGFRLQYTNYALANAVAGVTDTSSLLRLQGREFRDAGLHYDFGPFPWFGGEMLFFLDANPSLLVLYDGLERALGASWDSGLLLQLGLGSFEQAEVAQTLRDLGFSDRPLGDAVHLSVTDFQPGTLDNERAPALGLDLRDVIAGDGFVLFVRDDPADLAGLSGGATLAEDPTLAAFAQELDGLPVFGAYLIDTRENGFPLPGALNAEPGPVQLLPRYEALGIATGVDEGGFFALAMMWFASDAEAGESVALIESNFELAQSVLFGDRFGDQFELTEVNTTGQMARVLLRPIGKIINDPGAFVQMATNRDLAFIASR